MLIVRNSKTRGWTVVSVPETGFFFFFFNYGAKNLPAIQETQVRSLGWEDPLEEEMATHSSILAWSIPWTEEPGGLQSMGSHRVRQD